MTAETQYRTSPGMGKTYRIALRMPVTVINVSAITHVGNEKARS